MTTVPVFQPWVLPTDPEALTFGYLVKHVYPHLHADLPSASVVTEHCALLRNWYHMVDPRQHPEAQDALRSFLSLVVARGTLVTLTESQQAWVEWHSATPSLPVRAQDDLALLAQTKPRVWLQKKPTRSTPRPSSATYQSSSAALQQTTHKQAIRAMGRRHKFY